MDLKPMLCAEMNWDLNNILKNGIPEGYVAEYKFDGTRVLMELTRNDIRIFNRHAQDITFKFPEFLGLMRTAINNNDNVKSIILDGEIISQQDNFREILQRTSLLNPTEIRLRSSKYPLKFMVFDVLQFNDDRLLDIPLMTRKGILDGIVKDTERIMKVPYYQRLSADFGINEGLVLKRKMSQYYPNYRSKEWVKVKRFDYTTCEIKGFHLGERGQNIVLETEQGEVSVSSRDRIAQFHRDSPKFVIVRHLPVNVKDKMRQPIFIDFSDGL